jgi:putative tryptophan/tyrosine transport system substrate-binding protein
MFELGRREFITLLGGAAATWPLPGIAQHAGRVRLIGMLMPYPEGDVNAQARVQVFRQELTRLGWPESGVRYDVRFTTDNMDQVRTAAASLVAIKPDVIVCVGDRVVAVLRQLTRSVPVVAIASDLAGSGFVEGLARPGGNVTGFSVIEFSVIGKMVGILKELVSGISRVGIMYNPDNPVGAIYLRSFETVSAGLGFQPIDLPVHQVAEIERAVETLAESPNAGFIVPPDVTLITLSTKIAAIAALHRVPAIYSSSLYAKAGGLASYGSNINDLTLKQAFYVDRVLRGARPDDLPIQQPTKFDLVINLKTAKALGLEVPPTLLARADEVIE